MSQTVRLSAGIIADAKVAASLANRSLAGQITHWAQLGKLAEAHPEMSFRFIKEILMSRSEAQQGQVEPYLFGQMGSLKDGEEV